MSKLQGLKEFINLRLNAAVEEIFGHVERTLAEYEEEMDRRHHKLFETGLTPQVELKGADVQQLVMVVEEVPPEQQDWSSSLDREDPEPTLIKEEQEELWTSQEEEQHQGLEEADITKFPFTPVPVKSEEDEEKPQSSQLHQRHTEHMEAEAAREDYGGPGSGAEPGPDDKTEDSSEPGFDDCEFDWTRKSQSRLKSVQNYKIPISEERCLTDQNLSICTECGKRFSNKTNLKVHMLIHTRAKPFGCLSCGKSFSEKQNLIHHMEHHRDNKPFGCSVCDRRFRYRGGVWIHEKTHFRKKAPESESLD